MASHGKLERPTVVEVILGFHFTPAHPLDQYIDSLTDAFQQRYAEREELVYENFTLQLPAKPESGRLISPQITEGSTNSSIMQLPSFPSITV